MLDARATDSAKQLLSPTSKRVPVNPIDMPHKHTLCGLCIGGEALGFATHVPTQPKWNVRAADIIIGSMHCAGQRACMLCTSHSKQHHTVKP
jgi:hypothetical protein